MSLRRSLRPTLQVQVQGTKEPTMTAVQAASDKRKKQEYILLTYLSPDRRRLILMDLAKERMQEHPTETLSVAYAVIEAEYYSVIQTNRYTSHLPFPTTYSIRNRD